MLGGTRFIGVYLARMLVEAGHDVTLLTRGKKPVTYRIPDDTGARPAAAAAALLCLCGCMDVCRTLLAHAAAGRGR